ncbi:MAG: hypothetical protein LBT00_00070 [Spirochaetaceae bacterium]|nr:hypothetical protein [Spirochaetaceae bacterium]
MVVAEQAVSASPPRLHDRPSLQAAVIASGAKQSSGAIPSGLLRAALAMTAARRFMATLLYTASQFVELNNLIFLF